MNAQLSSFKSLPRDLRDLVGRLGSKPHTLADIIPFLIAAADTLDRLLRRTAPSAS